MNIYEKIVKVMEGVQYLSKDTSVEYKSTKYKAVSEEKVTAAVREQLVKQGLVIFPVEQMHKKEDYLTTVDVTYRIVNAENPDEFIEVVSSGTGVDTQDKGVGKAMTYAYKYMLLRTFAIPTGDDPDKVASTELDDNLKKDVIDGPKIASLKSELARVGKTEAAALKYCKVDKIEDITIEGYKSLMDQMRNAPTVNNK